MTSICQEANEETNSPNLRQRVLVTYASSQMAQVKAELRGSANQVRGFQVTP